MLQIGTKGVLLESSHEGGVGPRKGSIFYMSEVVGISAFDGFCVIPMRVVFSRYGFEKKIRTEKREIIALFPITEDDTIKTMTDAITNINQRIVSKKNAEFKEALRGSFGLNKTAPIVMVGPVIQIGENLLTCDIQELRAWLESIIGNEDFRKFIVFSIHNKSYTRYKGGPATDIRNWNATRKLLGLDKTSKDAYYKTLDSTIKERINLISFIHSILPVFNRHQVIKQSNIKHDQIYNQIVWNHPNINEAYKLIVGSIFIKPAFDFYAKTCRDTGADKMATLVASLENLIDQFCGLSYSVVTGNS